ncbi:type 1 glutamine amidotransferase domain-containing protein [Mycobacterium colombiense]|uniref:Type 1 glutamine amidotransferase domain-containing protein n=1 Tax=Mycobacterium colombiense TaxID=339268 RepID=A0A329KZ20_9MYCO|nr:DJ-1/PfpI family protein [Mycobacterium colombiense]RAU97236.1 type 1 glutamine amidotransferase domain-containing protein [Mycobacterium colombiense]
MATTTAPRVLVVVSAADRIPLRNGRSELTGTYLGELIEPTDAMRRAGFELAFATPGARAPAIDGTSCSLMYFAGSRKRRDAALSSYRELLELGLAAPAKLEEISHDAQRLDGFDAMFVPGGHAPLVDLLHRDAFADDSLNDDFGALVRHFHDARRPTGLICHAPAALAAAPTIDGRWTYADYRMTCFKTGVDTMLSTVPLARRFKGRLKDDPTELLRSRGAHVEQTVLPMGSKVVEDRELITGQDPYSAKAFGAAFVNKVRAARA